MVPISIAAPTSVARRMALMDFVSFAVALLVRLSPVAAGRPGLRRRHDGGLCSQSCLLPQYIHLSLGIFCLLVEKIYFAGDEESLHGSDHSRWRIRDTAVIAP